jgi:anti-sigma factor RsiW
MHDQITRMMNRMLAGYENSGTMKKAMISAFMHHFPGQISCVEFDEFMSDYLEGNLPEAQRRKFNFHLEACPMCRKHFGQYRAAVDLARASAAESPADAPQELINAILAARDPVNKH